MTKKLKLLLAIAAIAGSQWSYAQTDGVYKLVQLKAEKAKNWTSFPWIGELTQYKICVSDDENKYVINLSISGDMTDENIHFTAYRDSLWSGKPEDKQGIRFYDVTNTSFKEKWYSTYTNHIYFPHNEWVIEQWEKVDLRNAVADNQIINWLIGYPGKSERDSFGIKDLWIRKGFAWTWRGNDVKTTFVEDKRPQDYEKIYGDEYMMTILSGKGNAFEKPGEVIEGWFGKVEYVAKDLNREWNSKVPVIVKWIDKNNIHCIFVDGNGNTIREVWERAGE